ncbi:hypothetical protein [Halosimplex aquaticum]|uniref:hypothetical protein n=1 Tax=Halosimplex aquaticum TaxID=3026162 RepID=UPI0023676A22|nr:hypothetical protein [Halosimplex aquaticum]
MVATVGAAAADASSQAAGADRSTPLSCEYDDYTPPRLGGEWTATFEDGLAADSQARWDGGRIVQVGVGGDCSLFVADGRTAMLPNVTVNGTRGVVTGTVDLGADGQLRFVDAAAGSGPSVTGSPVATATARSPESTVSTASAASTASTASGRAETGTKTVASDPPADGAVTEANATALVIANDGPDFSTTAVVSVGNRSENVSLPSGRFFDVAVQRKSNGTVRVAVWAPDDSWDREWDARFEDAGTAAWRPGLHGRAFLDGIAVGVSEADDAQPGSGSPAGQQDSASPDDEDDEWPGPGTWPGGADPPDEREEPGGDGESGGGSIFAGLLLTVFGALGVKFAYGFALLGEQLDAIGSRRRASEVEPAEWNVALTRIGSGLVALVGLYLLATGLL